MNLKPDPEDYVLCRAGANDQSPRTIKFSMLENAKRPSTDRWCIRCNKALKPGQKFRYAHVINGGGTILHPDDEHLYTSDAGDCGLHTLGISCAKALGIEWTSKPSA